MDVLMGEDISIWLEVNPYDIYVSGKLILFTGAVLNI